MIPIEYATEISVDRVFDEVAEFNEDSRDVPESVPFPLPDSFIREYSKRLAHIWQPVDFSRKTVRVPNEVDEILPHPTYIPRDRNKICDDITEALGGTTMLRLNRFCQTLGVSSEILAKYEAENVGGSMKDRTAMNMLHYEMSAGRVHRGDFIVESTSGNTGISLAMAANAFGCRAILTMPDKMSKSKADIMSALGAQVIRTDSTKTYTAPEAHIGVAEMVKNIINYIAEENEKKKPGIRQPRAWYMNQYLHNANPHIHYHVTAEEILAQTQGKIDALVMSVGTGGSITGVAAKLKEKVPGIQIVAVEPLGSIIATPDDRSQLQKWTVEGIGKDFRPSCLNEEYLDKWVRVSDTTSFAAARLAMKTDGLMVGGSCGTVLAAAAYVSSSLPPKSRIVVVLPDSIRNYLNTFISNEWLVYQGHVHQKVLSASRSILSPDCPLISHPASELEQFGSKYVEVDASENIGSVLLKCQMDRPSVIVVKSVGSIISGVVSVSAVLSTLSAGDLSKTDIIQRVITPNTFAIATKDYSISEIRMLLHLLNKGMLVNRPFVIVVDGIVPSDLITKKIDKNMKITSQLASSAVLFLVDADVIAEYELENLKF